MTEGSRTGSPYEGANRSPNDDELLPGDRPAGEPVGAAPEPRVAQHGGMADQPGGVSEPPGDVSEPTDLGDPG
jgi:hypothetical protein